MHPAWTMIALCIGAVGLGACDKTPTNPPVPKAEQSAPAGAGATAGSPADPSVPSAESVLTPATAAKADPAQGRSNNTMSATQESNAMPMPGQNNDHSAPLGTARRASAP